MAVPTAEAAFFAKKHCSAPAAVVIVVAAYFAAAVVLLHFCVTIVLLCWPRLLYLRVLNNYLRVQCDVAGRRLAQASVVDTDLGKVKGGLESSSHTSTTIECREWRYFVPHRDLKHFGLNITGRALFVPR
jgi:hypothetical protein